MTREALVVCALLTLVVASGVATVYVKHLSRSLFVDLQILERQQDEMQIEWGKLELEQSTWASHDRSPRFANVAAEQLDLFMPPGDSVEVVNLR